MNATVAFIHLTCNPSSYSNIVAGNMAGLLEIPAALAADCGFLTKSFPIECK